MGYELTRFTHAIDEEFHCSICTMVLKDPMQSPCGCLFCNDCIRGWLAVDESCPVERGPLKLEDVKPTARAVRNFVNKFEIKCDFESKGCRKILKLVDLEDHVGRCEYNPNTKVICDKGCNIEMRRHEYETKNCFRHWADQAVCQQETILKLNDQQEKLNDEVTSLRRQQDDYDDKLAMINDEVKRQSEAIEALNDELNRRGVEIERLKEDLNRIRRREDEFVKLNEEICDLRRQIEQRENEIVAHSDETSKLGNETSNEGEVLVDGRPEFRVMWEHGTISIDKNVLEDNGWGYVQLVNPLEPTKFSFKFKILSLGVFILIGLAPMCPSGGSPKFTAFYRSNGWLRFNGKNEKIGLAWKVGDIIECGINFPSDFVNDSRDVRFYFNQNGKLMQEELVAMPIDGLFPTVYIRGGSKIKYLSD